MYIYTSHAHLVIVLNFTRCFTSYYIARFLYGRVFFCVHAQRGAVKFSEVLAHTKKNVSQGTRSFENLKKIQRS